MAILLSLSLSSNAFTQKSHSIRVTRTAAPCEYECFKYTCYSFYATGTSAAVQLFAKKQDDSDNNKKKDPKGARKSRDLSEEEMNMMGNQRTLYNTVDTLITTGGILFILVGFALNLVGLDYVVKDGRVSIGTTEDRKFQNEMVRKRKSTSSPNTSYDFNTNMLQMQPRRQRDGELSQSITALEEI